MAKTPVEGYRELTKKELSTMNDNKQLEAGLLDAIDAIENDVSNVDKRWLAIARTHLEQGFMALNRAVARPERVKVKEEK